MRALIQRVSRAEVRVGGEIVGQIGKGLVILLGVRSGDGEQEARFLADKCVNMRIFEDAEGKFNLSAHDVGAEVLVISQFTLYADTRKGRRPSFIEAAPPEISEPLYHVFLRQIAASGLRTEAGIFGAMMDVELVNRGPVTILAEKEGTVT